jgi:hypothetical protein
VADRAGAARKRKLRLPQRNTRDRVLSRQANAAKSTDVGPYSVKFACGKCGDEREVQMPDADADPMTVEKYTALLKVAGMVLLCDDCAPHGCFLD